MRARLPRARVVHLATHAAVFAAAARARDSFVALAPDPASDGPAYAGPRYWAAFQLIGAP